jgi:hypothetical protein
MSQGIVQKFSAKSRFIEVDIYTNSHRGIGSNVDCTLNGATGAAMRAEGTRYYVQVPGGNYSLDDLDNMDNPVVILLPGKKGGAINFVPELEGNPWTMFGGNFAWTSDSRFRELYPNPVPVHDRIEG